METRERQFKMWSDLILAYAKSKQVYSLTLGEMYDGPLCNNKAISRKLSMESLKQICEWMQANNFAEFTSVSKDKILVFWRSI